MGENSQKRGKIESVVQKSDRCANRADRYSNLEGGRCPLPEYEAEDRARNRNAQAAAAYGWFDMRRPVIGSLNKPKASAIAADQLGHGKGKDERRNGRQEQLAGGRHLHIQMAGFFAETLP